MAIILSNDFTSFLLEVAVSLRISYFSQIIYKKHPHSRKTYRAIRSYTPLYRILPLGILGIEKSLSLPVCTFSVKNSIEILVLYIDFYH